MPSSEQQWQSEQNSANNRLWKIETDQFIATVSEYGGHLVRFFSKTLNGEVLFVSPKADLSGNMPIRAGIPICWPWFSDMPAPEQYQQAGKPPSHGFARSSQWQLIHQHAENGAASIEFALPQDIIAQNLGSKLSLTVRYTLTDDHIKTDLITINHSPQRFHFTQALHTYFAVQSIDQTTLQGLAQDYLDKTRDFNCFAGEDQLTFTREVDRVYLSTAESTMLHSGNKTLQIRHDGHDSVVVWNPWKDNCAKLNDMEADSYTKFVCVETANTQTAVELKPGQQSHLQQVIDFTK